MEGEQDGKSESKYKWNYILCLSFKLDVFTDC